MQTNHNPECAGCGETAPPEVANRAAGRRAVLVCGDCVQRAKDSEAFARQLSGAIGCGTTVPQLRGIFGRLGLSDIPHDLAQVDRAMALPAGTASDAMREFLRTGRY